jgi:glycosyltransferase involved in cell wall biosynthesis
MKISIITTSFNSVKTIEDTLESVLGQVGVELEYIVVDGGSTDGTLDILNKYHNRLAHIISEPDHGMYDAMNKGIKLATGEAVGILNSDDVYADNGVLKTVMEEFEKTGADCVWGDLVMVDGRDTSKPRRTWKSSNYKEGSFKAGWHPPHPTFFVRREIYEKYGLFRTDLSTAGDFELMLRFLEKNKISSSHIPQTLVKMRAGGESNKSIYNHFRAIWYSYQAFKISGLKVSPIFIFLKPFAKLKQFFQLK